ncbi:MAG: hypothetical protein SVW51_15030 [Pseudomonadota bacterium]|nr:hypothetical protein [Pseudomonadota bacterium]
MKKVVIIEGILVLITGVALVFIKLASGGSKAVGDIVHSVETDPYVVYPLFIFLGLSVLIRAIRKNFGVSVYRIKSHMQFVEEVFEGVGAGLLSIYRLAVGVAISVPPIWYFLENDTFDLRQAVVIEVIGIIFFCGLCLLSFISQKGK